jgi:hypothetical protein
MQSPPEVTRLHEPAEVLNLQTTGARFASTVQTASGTARIVADVRWIDQQGDPAVEVVKDFFLAPLARMGAARLVDAIRAQAGLPLLWEVRIVNERPDGTTVQGSVVMRAAEMGNPPERLPE